MKNFKLMVNLVGLLFLTQVTFAQNSNIELRSTLSWPGQTLANVCGYTAPDGKEYALVGGSKGLIIVDISNPDAPVEIVQIPGPDNLWKEIKTYSHYAYVTSEGGGGCQIVDLSALPSDTLAYHSYTGDGTINGQLNRIHALHIDLKKGFMYLFGSNLSSGGGVVCDLNTDPYNPIYVGAYASNGYIHDGFADNDTLYAGHIYAGQMAIVDMTNKANPQVLGTVETPAKFTHNIWLTDDHKTALTTDETGPSFLTSYDITDPSDITELDRFQTTPGSGSIGHNTHILNDWAITSWYTDGFNIVDAHRPSNLVQTGRYDTWTGGAGEGFDGCWGVFPYFPSGTIIASNIEPAQLFICSPTYKRACYLEGKITDGCTGSPLSGAFINIVNGDPLSAETSKNNGEFKTGQVISGAFSVVISKAGYISQTVNVTLTPGEVSELNILLEPSAAYTVSGTVINEITGNPVPNVPVVLSNSNSTYNLMTNANGFFNQNCVLSGNYSASAGIWGYRLAQNINITANVNETLTLTPGYYDDFALDYGWTTEAAASSGDWVRDIPIGTTYNGANSNTGVDSNNDGNEKCFVTGNGGGGAGADDVDNGTVTLTSPTMNLATWADAVLSFDYWFYNDGGQGGPPDDKLEVLVTNGTETVPVLTVTQSESAWRSSGNISLGGLLTLNNNVKVIFRTGDTQQSGHLVEAAVDVFSVVPGLVNTFNLDNTIGLNVSPNPSSSDFNVNYSFEGAQQGKIMVTNILGEIVEEKAIALQNGTEKIGAQLAKGFYFISVQKGNAQSVPVKVVKQ